VWERLPPKLILFSSGQSVGIQIEEANLIFSQKKLPMRAIHSNLDDYTALVESEIKEYSPTTLPSERPLITWL